jgi:transposase-like protein
LIAPKEGFREVIGVTEAAKEDKESWMALVDREIR